MKPKRERNDNKTRRMKEEGEKKEEFKTGLSLESLPYSLLFSTTCSTWIPLGFHLDPIWMANN